jgi:PAS domain S-box-containing protein
MAQAELVHRVAENAPAMLVYLDSELRVRFANRHCYELLGHAPREILGRLLAEIVDPGTLKYALAHVAEVERGNFAPREYVLRDKEGARRFLQVHAVPDRDAQGRAVGYFACTTDNSAARKMQAALSTAEERLGLALSATRAGIWDWDLQGGDVYYSPEFAAVLGYVEGRLPREFSFFAEIHPDDREAVLESFTDAIHAGDAIDREFRMRCACGGYRWLRGVGRAKRDPRTQAVARFAGTVKDVSARKDAELQLSEARALAQATVEGCLEIANEVAERRKLDGVRHELMAAANHEVRTPLASIIAALELLRDGRGAKGGPATEAFLALALQNAERLARVVEEWLDMERIDLGFTRLQCAPVDVANLVDSLLEEHALLAEAREVRLQGSTAAAARVSADAGRLRQAIAHLVTSAIERAPQGSAVRCQVGEREGRVTLLVEDEGPDALSGTDLGLGVARAIIERLGGTLCVANRPSAGVAFHVELPRLADG